MKQPVIKKMLASPADLKKYSQIIQRILRAPAKVWLADFKPVARRFFESRTSFLKMAKKYATPFYVIDAEELEKSLVVFKQAFQTALPGSQYFYAVKVNHHPYILRQAIKHGFGLDVSSSRELTMALDAKAKQIIFSGPGKTAADLALALKHRDKVIVNLDNFSELNRLGALAKKRLSTIKAGIRIYTAAHGQWSKFGIPLGRLKEFFRAAGRFKNIQLQGLQFHLSLNSSAEPYQRAIKEIAQYLKRCFNKRQLGQIKFIDLGGGFMVPGAEGHLPSETAQGALISLAAEQLGEQPKYLDRYYLWPAISPSAYAQGIALACQRHLQPLVKTDYFIEPGRVICNNAMHIVLRVVDVKSQKKVIVDGGINLVGWSHFNVDYAPVLNLTHPSSREKDCLVYGSLCLPEDLWGRWCWAKKMSAGDVLLVPYQGAMTYALAQQFIKGIAPAYVLKKSARW